MIWMKLINEPKAWLLEDWTESASGILATRVRTSGNLEKIFIPFNSLSYINDDGKENTRKPNAK